MTLLPKSKLWREIIIAGIFILLVVIFYAEEDWRGKIAWENCQRELAAKGESLNWKSFIPPQVPDDQNFFAAPKMQEWFVEKWPTTNEFAEELFNTNTFATITNKTDATNYLAWSDQFQPDFNLIREALKRPYARMNEDYSDPIAVPHFDFVCVRSLAQTLAQRAKCYLLIGQSEKALDELTLLNNSRRMLEAAPAGKPITIIAGLINAAIAGLYANVIANGLQLNAWHEPQLKTLQNQLDKINFLPIAVQSSEFEAVDSCCVFQNFFRKYPSDPSLWWELKHFSFPWEKLKPRGWVYQNMATVAEFNLQTIDAIDLTNNFIQPQKINHLQIEAQELDNHFSAYTSLIKDIGGLPHVSKEFQAFAYFQTLVNEAQIACALERYHLANGNYPETLDLLAPKFMQKIPHDIIGGQPLHYRCTNDGKFLLYSVGWNETDDGGLDLSNNGQVNYTNGDWVWLNSSK
jgi:hypothetical protein